jgi:hypothetical protein
MKIVFCKTGSDRLIIHKFMIIAHGDKRHWLHKRLNESVKAGQSCRRANEEALLIKINSRVLRQVR